MQRICALIVMLTLAAGLRGATAQDRPPLKATVDLGFVNTAGNSEVTTVNVGENVTYRMAPWVFAQSLSWVEGRTGDATTASNWKAGLRADYEVSGRLRAYALAGWERNRFAGIARRFEEGAGVAFGVLTTAADVLDIEAGVSYNQQRSVSGLSDDFAAGRLAGKYRRALTGTAFLQQTLEWLSNFKDSEDQRLNSESAVVAPLSERVGLKLTYIVRFDNLPEPGFQKTDRIFTAGVQIVF